MEKLSCQYLLCYGGKIQELVFHCALQGYSVSHGAQTTVICPEGEWLQKFTEWQPQVQSGDPYFLLQNPLFNSLPVPSCISGKLAVFVLTAVSQLGQPFPSIF